MSKSRRNRQKSRGKIMTNDSGFLVFGGDFGDYGFASGQFWKEAVMARCIEKRGAPGWTGTGLRRWWAIELCWNWWRERATDGVAGGDFGEEVGLFACDEVVEPVAHEGPEEVATGVAAV